MPTSPVQLALAVFELTLLFAGGGLFLSLVFQARQRQRWLGTNALPYWQISIPDFAILAVLVLGGALAGQSSMQLAVSHQIEASPDKTGWQVFVYGASFHAGILLGCALFPLVRGFFRSDLVSETPPLRAGPSLPWTSVFRYAGGTLIVALPVVGLLSLGWTALLRAFSLPAEPQDLIAIFSETKSPLVVAGMLSVACVLAPISEELIFRAGLYRYIRQKLGRVPALLASGLLFGALHGNWAGFLPLAALGMLLAVAYEATGSIAVVMITHAFFNLNTILIVFSGLPQTAP